MSFFDNLTKKANDAYQTTKEKTVQITNEIRMKAKVNEKNDKIQTLYKELGIMVFDSYKSNVDVPKDELNSKCDEINSLLEEVASIKIDILTLKKLKQCVSCGAEIDQDDLFCPKCGTKQPEIKQEDTEVEETENNNEELEIKVEKDSTDNDKSDG